MTPTLLACRRQYTDWQYGAGTDKGGYGTAAFSSSPSSSIHPSPHTPSIYISGNLDVNLSSRRRGGGGEREEREEREEGGGGGGKRGERGGGGE